MKKKILMALVVVALFVFVFATITSAETAYVNSKGEQVEAGSEDIAYELNISNPYNDGGNCNITEVYLYDKAITKIVIPAIKFVHPTNGYTYDLSTYSYCRLAGSWANTLPIYPISEKDAETKTSLHTQIKEIEFYVPILADGSGTKGNLAGYTGLEKVTFYSRAYEPQSKGGFLSGCSNVKEIHFYGKNNYVSSNFFCNSMTKVVFHRGSTSSIKDCAMQSLNGKDCTVYLNRDITPWNAEDPRLTWNKSGSSLKFVLLVDDTTGYTPEEIASYQTEWQAGNNKSANNYKYTATIQTYCDFYDEHLSENQINDCVCYCDTCKEYGALANPTHLLDYVMEYANGYNGAGTKTTACTNEGCTHVDSVVTLKALFETRGYSKDTESSAIVLDFTANKDEIEAYEAYLKTINAEASINFGVAVALGDNDDDVTNDVLFDENGEQKAGTVVVKFNDKSYTNIQTKIMGINNNETALHLSGYVNVSGVITYINGEEIGEYSKKVNYGMFEE